MSMHVGMKGGFGGSKQNVETPKPKSTWGTIKRLLRYMKSSRLLIVMTLLITTGGTMMQVITPKILGSATTLIFDSIKHQTEMDFSRFGMILLTVGALYLGVFITSFLQARMMTVVSLKTTKSLRDAVKAKLNRVPISFFDQHSTGDLMSVATNDIDNISTNLQESMTQLISSVILVVGSLAIMLTISPMLTLLSCVVVPASLLITKIVSPAVRKNNKKYMQSLGALNGKVEETYQNFTLIKSFEGEKDALETFRASNEDIRQSGWRARFFGSSMMHFMMLVQNAVYVLIAAIGAMGVMSGGMSIGNLQAFLQYAQQFSSPVAKLSQIWASLLSAVASAERVFHLLDAKEMTVYQQDFEEKAERTKIVFDQVQFGYGDTPLMTNFTLEVNEGQTVAIVGHTGAGKTTLVNLLERFYEIQGGSIYIDGVDIRSVSHHILRGRIGMVLQDTWLFSGTIYENIKYGNTNATDEQVYAAAKAAFADDFISKLPNGYHTILDEDAGNISQGQKQLITIARAFVADPEIIILDEATSNVDSRTEMVIQKAMQSLLQGRTSIVVAHRLSTIQDADNIVVMQNGDVVETGTHKELLTQKGTYADIYNSQFAGKCA